MQCLATPVSVWRWISESDAADAPIAAERQQREKEAEALRIESEKRFEAEKQALIEEELKKVKIAPAVNPEAVSNLGAEAGAGKGQAHRDTGARCSS